MRKILLIAAAILIMLTTLTAQIRWDQENGIPIRQGHNIEWFRAGASMNDGTVIYTWSDTRFGGRDVYAQRVDQNGQKLWNENGLQVDGKVDRQEDPVVINTTDNCVIIAWIDFSIDPLNGDVFAQKIDMDGNLLWDDGGVPICTASDIQITLNIVQDQNGGAYVIWKDERNTGGTDIYGVHLSADGENLWQENGLPLADGPGAQVSHTFWEDGQGGAILAYENNVGEVDIKVTQVNSDGSSDWDQEITLCDAELVQQSPKISPDGTGSFIITWQDKRSNYFDIYAQRIDLDGNIYWQNNGIPVYTADNEQSNPRITTASDGGAFIVWEDKRNDIDYKDLYIQKLDIDGNLVWNEDGVIVSNAYNDQQDPRLKSDDNGGVFVAWNDSRENVPNVDIYAQRFDQDGNPQMTDNGKLVSNAPGKQFNVLVKKSDDYFFVNWGDMRTGSIGVSYQVFDNTGNELLEENGISMALGLSGQAQDMVSTYDPHNDRAIFAWIDSRLSSFGRQIYVQALDRHGKIYQENGKPLLEEPLSNISHLDITAREGGGAVLIWQGKDADSSPITFAQAIDSEGNSLWQENGVPLGLEHNMDDSYAKVTKIGNQYYFGWSEIRAEDFNWTVKMFGNKISENGEVLWGEDSKEIVGIVADCIISDLVGRYYIYSTNDSSQTSIRVKKVNENGETADSWPDEGKIICDIEDVQVSKPKGIMTENGLLIVWKDLRNNDSSSFYGQLINEDGNIQWEENGKPLVSYTTSIGQHVDQTYLDMVYDEELYFSWTDARTTPDKNIASQKFDLNGNMLWNEDAVYVADKDSTQTESTITTMGNDLFVAFRDYGSADSDIFAQCISDDGSINWSNEGLAVCTSPRTQKLPDAVELSDGTVVLAWIDGRSSGKTEIYGIYAQSLNSNGISVEEDHYSNSSLSNITNYPNPYIPSANSETKSTFSFNLKNACKVQVDIFNIRGQKVKTLVNKHLISGQHEIMWNGKNNNNQEISSGIYFYKIKAGEDTKTNKMLILK